MKPTIDLCVVTWPRDAARLGYLAASLQSFLEFCRASRHDIKIYVSGETANTTPENQHAAWKICNEYGAFYQNRESAPSLGGNMNSALAMGRGDYKLLVQDDWAWNKQIDLSLDAEFLERRADFALLRYATFYTEFLDIDFSDYYSVNMAAPYAYGDQPHLRRADWKTRLSATGGKPVGHYRVSDPGDYASPEHLMGTHLTAQGWKIAAYSPNAVDHIGSLSSAPERRPQEA